MLTAQLSVGDADFERVYEQGRRHFSPSMTVFFLERETGGGPRVGLTVGKVLGGAVTRNRIKRRMREAIRRHLLPLAANVDVVINPKRAVLKVEFTKLTEEIRRTFEVVNQKAKLPDIVRRAPRARRTCCCSSAKLGDGRSITASG